MCQGNLNIILFELLKVIIMEIGLAVGLFFLITFLCLMCKRCLLYYTKCVIEGDKIFELKKSHMHMNGNMIMKKACMKYYILTIISFVLTIFCFFLISYMFPLYLNLIFTLPLFLFILLFSNKFRIVLKLCRCPHCHSRLKCSANVNEVYNAYKFRTFGRMYRFGDVEFFYDCKKCGEKLYEEDKKFDLIFFSIIK